MASENIIMALQILGVLLLLYLIFNRSEHIYNADIPAGIGSFNTHLYTSGATMRVIGQVFSSSNQGVVAQVHNTENPSEIKTIKILPITERLSTDIPANLPNAGHLYTSGATLRVLGQSFSSTNQGRKAILHNSDNPNQQIPVYITMN